MRNNRIVLLIILVIFVITLWVLFPVNGTRFGRQGLRLGLELKGGVELSYKAQFTDNISASEKSSAMSRVLLVVEKRIDTYGVVQPIIQKIGSDEIDIQLPGFTDREAAKRLVEQTGFLEFREVEKDAGGNLVYLSNYLNTANTTNDFIDKQEQGSRVFVSDQNSKGTSKPVAILSKDASGLKFTDGEGNPVSTANLTQYAQSPSWIISRGDDSTPLTGSLLADAQPGLNTGVGAQPVVNIKWNSEGAIIFDQIAARLHDPAGDQGPYNLKYVLGIFLDNALISAPKVNSASFQGTGQIAGSFTTQSATELANLLKSGALPVKLAFLNGSDITATLGARFTNMVLKAGLIGMLLIMAFMIAYYRLPGFLASLALIFYGSLSLSIFKLWPVTLDMGGLGGFIASIGMAVDANVLIFERMKEEFRAGRTLGAAIDAGFHRAWSAIRDSNLTTVLACIILYWLGTTSALASSAVKGFSLTLAIGVLVSMFTAITVTRALLRMLLNTSLANKTGLFAVIGGKK